jgi:uncharacterized protein (TIRG00374 family)
MRRTLTLLAKAITSALLLYFSLRWVDVTTFTARLHALEPSWLIFAVFLLTVQTALLAARWQQITLACGARLGFGSALQISFIAAFFNQVLPSTVGGDGARIWVLARHGAGWAVAVYSVLIDRIVGVFILALIAVLCLPWTLQLIHEPAARAALFVIAFGALAAPLGFLLIGMRFQRWFDLRAITRHLAAASRAAAALCQSPRSLNIVVLCSIAIHLLTVAAAWCCISAVAAPVSFTQILFLLPPVLLVATVPISIAGWGVRESTMIAAFAYSGLAQSDGLTLSILFGAAYFFLGILGGIIWIISGLRMEALKRAVADAESAIGKS